ncbi:MAG: hypothetical protein IPK19_11105 [Chloroflexi bacterium]|nr:hypothetical protein [Chloroflexota bacterium]
MANNAQWVIEAGGVVELRPTSDVNPLRVGGTGSFTNHGTINHTTAGMTDIQSGVTFVNHGVVNVSSGTLLLGNGSASTGSSFNTNVGARTVTYVFTLAEGVNLSGSGSFELDGTTTFTGQPVISTNVLVWDGILIHQNELLVTGTLTLSNATLTGPGTTRIAPGGTLEVPGGQTHVNAPLVIEGVSNFIGTTTDTLTGTSTTQIALGGVMNTYGTYPVRLNNHLLENAGTMVLNGPIEMANNGQWVNEASGVVQLRPTSYQYPLRVNGTGSFTNYGTVSQTATAGLAIIHDGVTFTNHGLVEVTTGMLQIYKGSASSGSSFVTNGSGTTYVVTFTLNEGVNLSGSNDFIIAGPTTFTGNPTIGAKVRVDGGTLLMSNELTVTGTLTLSNATLTGPGTTRIAPGGTLEVPGGQTHVNAPLVIEGVANFIGTTTDTLTGTSTTQIALGGVMNTYGTYPVRLNNHLLENAGTMVLNGPIEMANNGQWVNLAGGVVQLRPTSYQYPLRVNGIGSFTNYGTVSQTATAGLTIIDDGVTFTNHGLVEATTGMLQIYKGSASSGSSFVTDGSGTTYVVTFTLNEGVTLSGSNDFIIAGPATFTGNSTISAKVRVDGGTLLMSNELTVTGTLTLSNATLTGPGTTRIAPGGTLEVPGGQTHVNAPLVIEGVANFIGTTTDTLTGTSITQIALGGVMNTYGTYPFRLNNHLLENAGTMVLNGPIEMANNGQWVNLAGGVVQLRPTSDVYPLRVNGTGSFINHGTVSQMTVGTTFIHSGVTFTNHGTANVQSGTLALENGIASTGSSFITNAGARTVSYSFTFEPGVNFIGGGTLVIGGPTIISGTQTIGGNLHNDGGTLTVSTGSGSITVNGNYTQSSGGILNIELGGLSPATQYDQVVVTGTAALAGTLNLALINGFDPAIGNAFQIMTFGSRSGTFGTVNGTSIGGGRQLQVSYSGTAATVNTIATP